MREAGVHESGGDETVGLFVGDTGGENEDLPHARVEPLGQQNRHVYHNKRDGDVGNGFADLKTALLGNVVHFRPLCAVIPLDNSALSVPDSARV